MQHKQQYTHQPPHPHRQPHIQTKDNHMTTDTSQGHRPNSRSERNLIILQVNINGILKKTRGAQTAYSRHTSQFRKPSPPLEPKHPKYMNSPSCELIGCTSQEVGSLHLLETTLHSLQQTYLRTSIHTTQ